MNRTQQQRKQTLVLVDPMRAYLSLFSLLALFSTFCAPLAALDWQNGCCPFVGSLSMGLDALYWKPCGSEFQYAFVEVDDGSVSRHLDKTVVGDCGWGSHLYFTYWSQRSCCFATLEWTYLRTTDANSAAGEDLMASHLPMGIFDRASGRIRFEYNRAGLKFGRKLWSCGSSYLTVYAGGRYVNIEETRSIRARASAGERGNVDEKSRFEGGGVELGLGGRQQLWCGFGLEGNLGAFGAAGLVRDDFHTFDSELTTPMTVYDVPSHTICVPGMDLRLAVTYTYCGSCWNVMGEIGYAMDYYWRALSLRSTIDTTLSERTSIGFAGPFAGLRIKF